MLRVVLRVALAIVSVGGVMLKFIQNNREITALLAVVLLFVLPGFLDRQYLSVQTLTMVYSGAANADPAGNGRDAGNAYAQY